jgi:chorismate mutase/prephenate dehydratase
MIDKNDVNTDDHKDPIKALRSAIDEIDQQMLDLLNRRFLLAKEIGKVKAKKGDQVVDTARESRLFQRLFTLNKGPVSKDALYHIYTEIIAASREIQSSRLVTYLGPEATFTHVAAMNHFGRSYSFVPQASIRDVFDEVSKASCHYGVVPVENSIEGSVNHTLDLFFESNLRICAEVYLRIQHDLLSPAGDLEKIETVYSHPHAFAQCRKWLRRNLPGVTLKECSSTATAARQTLANPASAAIASREAAHIYDLQVVASRIEDIGRNVTRFLVIGNDETHRTGEDKTSLMFVTGHVPGALHRVLQPIADAGINMVKLESRPTKHENWSYFFFMDLEGHMADPVVKETVEKMKQICMYLKCLGSYPRAREANSAVESEPAGSE